VVKTTKNQHYVFQAYLRAWAENDLIYCLRDGKVFHPNLAGVACERFFYRLQELTPKELELVENFFREHPSESLKTAQRDFMFLYFFPTRLKKQLGDAVHPELLAALDKLIAEGEEDYHQRVEDDLLIFLRQMLTGSTDFYTDDEQAARFLNALCIQFMRTKQVREAAVNQIGTNFKSCDVRRMMGVLCPLMAMAVGQSLYVDRKKFKLVLLDNDTDTPFITADQPIINLQATHTGKPPEELELFYPLSPRKAMLLLESSSKRSEFLLGAASVNNYNMMMVKNSHQQVFSNSKGYLNSIKCVVGLT
jgi:hypothetical protein